MLSYTVRGTEVTNGIKVASSCPKNREIVVDYSSGPKAITGMMKEEAEEKVRGMLCEKGPNHRCQL